MLLCISFVHYQENNANEFKQLRLTFFVAILTHIFNYYCFRASSIMSQHPPS